MTILRIIAPCFIEQTRDLDGVDARRRPPGLLVAGAMNRAVMRAAQRHGEFVAHLAAERPWLQITKVVWIGLFAAAHQAGLLGNKAEVLPATAAPWCRNGEPALVDATGLIEVAVCFRAGLMGASKVIIGS